MKQQIHLLLLSSLMSFSSCGDNKTNPPANNSTNPPNKTNTETKSPTPSGQIDYNEKYGFCEVTVDGVAKQKVAASGAHFKAWGDLVEEPLYIPCDGFYLIGHGDDTAFPMKPGKYSFYQPGGPVTGVAELYNNLKPYNSTGELTIETWDDKIVKGSFTAKSSIGTKGLTDYKENVEIKGVFEVKRKSSPSKLLPYGHCEYTINDGPKRHSYGGIGSIATTHWTSPNYLGTNTPLMINCNEINFSTWSGENTLKLDHEKLAQTFPMKPATYPITRENKAGTIDVGMAFRPAEGEFKIESWDEKGMKGSFEFDAKRALENPPTPLKIKGTFEFVCPMVKLGEACIKNPTPGKITNSK